MPDPSEGSTGMAELIDGKAIAMQIKNEVKAEVERLSQKGITLTLAVIQVGDNSASKVYVRNKKRACEYCGIQSREILLPSDTSQEKLLDLIGSLNEDDSINGILVQLPLPTHIDEQKIIRAIDPDKDVDGFHPQNVGALFIGLKGFLPCTPAGIIELLHRSGVSAEGKECVIAGRSNIVGKPMAALMLRENATVTVAHSRTRNLAEVTRRADILITAVGKPRMFTADYVKKGAVVIDCGMDRDENGHLCGDVDFDDVQKAASMITPVPGGVGPMTVAMLMKNCLASYELTHDLHAVR